MFEPVRISHGEITDRLLAAICNTGQRRVANAFLASLSTRRLEWRSALGSYAVFRHLQDHEPAVEEGRRYVCCGGHAISDAQDVNVLNFERFKWGGVRHMQPLYAMLDLELLAESEAPQPEAVDIQIFRALISLLRQLPPGITAAALQKKFTGAFKSNKSERDIIVAILGYCGVLSTPGHPGFTDAFVPVTQRALPHHHYLDMPYPACWWRSEDGLDMVRLHEYFGHVL